MKKAAIFFLTFCLMVSLFTFTPTPARADRFWSGVAIGVGSAIILGHLFHPPRVYYHDYRPTRGHNHPSYDNPPPPVYRGKWVPGHWVEDYDQNGNFHRYWVSEHWERIN